MADQQIPVNRTLVGLLALVCLAAGGGVWWWDTWDNVWCGSFVRTGVLLGAFWLALPAKGREAAWANISPWTLVAALGAALIFVRRPHIFFAVIAVVVVAAVIIKPRQRRK